jgi:methylisocitrate lyase
VDTGWGGAFNIARCVREMTRANVAGIHIEDQIMQKRCGHRPNKAIVTQDEMVDRVKAAVDARTDDSFVIMARTDALAVEGMNSALDRIAACVEAGADMIFPEAITELEQYQQVTQMVSVPVLANITEFGATPLFNSEQLASVGVKLSLYPLSAFRAMSLAALKVYQGILADGSQQNVVDGMQTRMELYDFLDYHQYEQTLDQLFSNDKVSEEKS